MRLKKVESVLFMTEYEGYLHQLDLNNISESPKLISQFKDGDHIHDVYHFSRNHYILCCALGLIEVNHERKTKHFSDWS